MRSCCYCMKSVLIIVKNLTSGGAEKQSVLLAQAMSDACRVHYIIFNGSKIHEKYISMMSNHNINIVSLKGSFISRFEKLISYIKENQIEYVFPYLTGANLISSLTLLFVKTKIYIGLRNSKLPFCKLIVDRFLHNHIAFGSVVNCYSGKNEFVKKGFNEKNMNVIQNCIDPIYPYMEKKDDEIYDIITVGRFVEQKDYETAIKAIALLKQKVSNLRFHIVGYGELEEKIRFWANQYGIRDHVNIYLNPNDIRSLLLKSDVFLSTSLFEGTSNSIMEAMNADLPIVATNVGDNFCLVEDHKNGYLVEMKNFKKISEALYELYENVDKRIGFGFRSKEIISERFTMEMLKQQYISLIQR